VDSLVKDIVSPIMSLASGKALEENFVILRKDSAFANPDVKIALPGGHVFAGYVIFMIRRVSNLLYSSLSHTPFS